MGPLSARDAACVAVGSGSLSVATGAPTELMATAGNANMSTTKQYLHLAGIVFPNAAERLEQRLLGGKKDRLLHGRKLYRPERTSEHLTGSIRAQQRWSDLS